MYHYTIARALHEERYQNRTVVRRDSPEESDSRRSAPVFRRRLLWTAVTSFATRSATAGVVDGALSSSFDQAIVALGDDGGQLGGGAASS